jgi:DNA invertase Pin-like site-specific DNA recombinase
MEGRYISYIRVSTQRQGLDGYGVDAQRKSITDFLNGGNWELIAEYAEVESGKRSDRPALKKALDHCKRTKSTLVISKIDRLSRNIAFLSNLMESGVEFIATDNPHANKLTVQLMAVMAENEREAISKRTKEALAAAKDRGVKLVSPSAIRLLARAMFLPNCIASSRSIASGCPSVRYGFGISG